MKVKKKYKKGGVLPPAIRALKKRAYKKEAPIYGGVLDEATVTSTKLDKKSVGEVAESVADDLSGKAGTTGFVASRKKSAFKLLKKAKESPRMKALRRIAKRTGRVGGALVAPPMLINPLKVGGTPNEEYEL
jgi:hypothetical protein